MLLRVLFGALFEVLVLAGMQMTVRAHFCKIDGGVQGGMQLGVLVQVVFWGCLAAV